MPFDHGLSGLEIRNNAVLQRANRLDVLVRFPVHLLCQTANGNDAVGRTVSRYDARLIHDDFILVVDNGVGSAEIDGDLLHEKIEQAHERKVREVERGRG